MFVTRASLKTRSNPKRYVGISADYRRKMEKAIKTTLVRGIEGWDGCRDGWERLLELSKPSHPFLLWTWVRQWAGRMAEEGNLPILVVVSKGGKTLAMIPLQVRKAGLLRVLEGLAQEFCDYVDWPGVPGAEKEVGQAFAGWLKDFSGGYDYARVYNLLPSGFAHAVLSGLSPGAVEEHSIAPQVVVSGSFEEYARSLNQKFYSDMKRRERKLVKDKGPYEYLDSFPNEALPEVIDTIAGWLGERLGSKGKSCYMERPGMKEHLVRVYGELNSRKILHLSAIKVQGRFAAINVAFRYGGALFSYTPVFDPEFSPYSIIRILKLKHIEQCFAEGLRLYDFCLGGEKYKLEFQPEIKQLYAFTRYSANLRGSVKRIFDRNLKPALKKSKLAHGIKDKYFKQS